MLGSLHRAIPVVFALRLVATVALVHFSEDARRATKRSANASQSPLLRSWMDHVHNMRLHFLEETASLSVDAHYAFETKWFKQKVDHINKQHDGYFWQRYFVYKKFTELDVDSSKAPLFVFCGAEQGSIYKEWQHFGFMVEVARQHGAKILYLEHRFFGESRPYGKEAFQISPQRIGLLSLEQSMADYVAIIEEHVGKGPVLTFGGSLSGTLAVMMRIQFPTLIDMAFASSAPILGIVGVADQFAWRKRLTQNFAELGGDDCPGLVRRGFAAFDRRNDEKLKKAFGLCDAAVAAWHWDVLFGMAWQQLENLGNFPYPEHKSRIPLACKRMREAPKGEDEKIFANFLNLGPNSPPPHRCLDLSRSSDTPQQSSAGADWMVGWSYMACTEVVHPIGANGVTDMFPAYDWSVASLSAGCEQEWNVTPDVHYLGRKIDLEVERPGAYPIPKPAKAVEGRILFSSGTRDPWGTMVPSKGWADDVIVVQVPGGGHCSDLATPTPEDSAGMREARGNISAVLGKWLTEVRPVRHMKIQPFGEPAAGRLRSFGRGVRGVSTAVAL